MLYIARRMGLVDTDFGQLIRAKMLLQERFHF
jgi:hypothetical protein